MKTWLIAIAAIIVGGLQIYAVQADERYDSPLRVGTVLAGIVVGIPFVLAMRKRDRR